ncbi:DNAH [Mytilus edulis]|uniref:DNAH n=1 Tax=Mytilus edulis TaxID=6550 RepID=A0A8S3U9W2_MYTED|nr:DNAH [Mytilus edulis]
MPAYQWVQNFNNQSLVICKTTTHNTIGVLKSVSLFLKDSWITVLRTHIRTSLRDVGKGWFNIHETNWEVYQISKLKAFMEMVKFIMQDSMRYLIQESLLSFTQMVIDACHSALTLEEEFVWGGDFIMSPFKPKRNALFLVDLMLDNQGAHYSTNLNSFESMLVGLFDKGIQSTQHIPQLEKYILEDITWSGTPLLESVGEHEPFVEELRDNICNSIRKAVIPMKAYAKEEYDAQEHTAQEVKDEVELHLKEREILENALPTNVVIGPFWVNTDQVKQKLCKKRKELSLAVLELLAKKLRKQADDMVVAGMAAHTDISRAQEIANEVRRINKQLKEAQTLAQTYNNRERLFGQPVTNYDKLGKLVKDFEPFRNLWLTVSDWLRWHESWMNDPLEAINAEEVEKNVNDSYKTMHKSNKVFAEMPVIFSTMALVWDETVLPCKLLSLGVQQVAAEIKANIEDFKPFIPLIQGLRNPGMRNRHWEQLSTDIGMAVRPKKNLTFSKCLEMGLDKHMATITKVAEVAGKEYSIEQALDKMEKEWEPVYFTMLTLEKEWEPALDKMEKEWEPVYFTMLTCLILLYLQALDKMEKEWEPALDKMEKEWEPVYFEIKDYKNTGTYILKASEETSQLLDDHIVMTQSMSFSPYKKPFEDRISNWENKLKTTQDVLDEWLACQRSWLYLEPIFSSDDIQRQLPVESKRYQTMDRIWRKIMKTARDNPQVISLCPDNRLLDNLRESNKLLEQVQKGLSEYLETKRNAFPRFYFLSDDELLEILSQTKDPKAVQPHLKKCFENIAKLQFEDDLKITKMFSGEGEEVDFIRTMYPTGNVEEWMLEIENCMKESMRLIIKAALEDYKVKARTQWVLDWPGQVVICGCQTYWTEEVSQALAEGNLKELFDVLLSQLDDLRNLVRTDISRIGRMTMSALIVVEVHARDVIIKMLEEGVANQNDFEWVSQIRYYWHDENMWLQAVNAEFAYGYEYLGNTLRLVITPLTDRCYLTLTGALHLKFGGAPAGPAGTGKTETTKDLAKAMANQCVVFNCSDQLDYMAMGKFFKGLASAGAWACFDEFNRIDIEVLSVVAQQITTIQKAQAQRVDRFIFEGVELSLKASCAVFITMNPGYAGRTELPDNLKALFRPVAMMVPDYALIAEISLFSFGFSDAKHLAKKIVTTFKLSSEQLSSQDHYDFGMRAVKSVISAAGNLKRQYQDMNEELICLRAIRDVNVPKFLVEDLKLFGGIVSDLFPNIKEEPIDYGSLETSLRKNCTKSGIKDVDGFINKCIQLFETTVVRHGLMLVGPTGSGKTKCYEVLKNACTALQGEMSPAGFIFDPVMTYILNPKSITMGQLYGEFDAMTHEWTDGILSTLIRVGSSSTDTLKRWYVFDGPVDAVWIESMNTVLDDNKKLCLSSGEIIKLTDHMTMMFEVSDLAVASPATVSRCGMVYLEPSYIGLPPFVECWLRKLPEPIEPYHDQLKELFDGFLQPVVKFVRKNIREVVDTVDCNLVFSWLKLLECFFTPFVPQEGDKPIPQERLDRVKELIEPWFIFSMIWSIGCTGDNDSWTKFSNWVREKMTEMKFQLLFPGEGLIYDYRLDDAGISSSKADELMEEEVPEKKEVCWKNWLIGCPEFTITPDTKFSDIIVPTIDNIRSSCILEMLLTNKKSVMSVGPTGTGKTLTIADKLGTKMPKEYIPEFMVFSAKTSANQTQDLIDGKLDKRRKGVFGPPLGKYFIFFIDDLNMPALEEYGAQPPIELIRQWMDFKGWYDRKQIGDFRNLVDVNFCCAMGPPGGGRNPISARLLRHFNFIAFTEMEDSSKRKIFGSIFKSWVGKLSEKLGKTLGILMMLYVASN